MAWYLICGSSEEARFFAVLGFASTMFTLPGAAILVLVEHVLLRRGLPRLKVGATLSIVGGCLGGLFLGLTGLGIYGYSGYLVGAVYGALTAIPLLMLRPSAGASPSGAH